MTDLAVIIVSWNVRNLLAACLHSLQVDLSGSKLSGEIWVVDNASSDGSVAMIRRDHPQVRLIASDKNLGFAGGNNAALRAVGFGDPENAASKRTAANHPAAVLLLNPDTEVHPGALQTLFDFLQRTPRAGIAGAHLVYGDGSFQHSAFAMPGLWQLAIELLPLPGRLVDSRLNGRYPQSLYERSRPFQIGHPLGAAMCVRGKAIQQVGLLDESYYMYVEEIDWSKRMNAAGWRAYCVPQAKVTHFGGQSAGQIEASSFIYLWSSRYQFYRRHYARLKVWLAALIVRAGMRRKAAQAAAAAARGDLSRLEIDDRLGCYDQVINIWQGKI